MDDDFVGEVGGGQYAAAQAEEMSAKYKRKPSPSLYKKKDRSKYVSDQSNLAKVFFIQEKNTFIELNKFYYFKIRHDFMDKQLKQQEQLEERSAQSKWNDYLQ